MERNVLTVTTIWTLCFNSVEFIIDVLGGWGTQWKRMSFPWSSRPQQRSRLNDECVVFSMLETERALWKCWHIANAGPRTNTQAGTEYLSNKPSATLQCALLAEFLVNDISKRYIPTAASVTVNLLWLQKDRYIDIYQNCWTLMHSIIDSNFTRILTNRGSLVILSHLGSHQFNHLSWMNLWLNHSTAKWDHLGKPEKCQLQMSDICCIPLVLFSKGAGSNYLNKLWLQTQSLGLSVAALRTVMFSEEQNVVGRTTYSFQLKREAHKQFLLKVSSALLSKPQKGNSKRLLQRVHIIAPSNPFHTQWNPLNEFHPQVLSTGMPSGTSHHALLLPWNPIKGEANLPQWGEEWGEAERSHSGRRYSEQDHPGQHGGVRVCHHHDLERVQSEEPTIKEKKNNHHLVHTG